MFGWKKQKEAQIGPQEAPQATQWHDMGNVAFAGENAVQNDSEALERQKMERQQRKIIRALSSRDFAGALGENDVQLAVGEREDVLDQISRGKILAGTDDRMLQTINPPEAEVALSAINTDETMRKVVAAVLGDPTKLNNLQLDDIEAFRKRFPTPIRFGGTKKEILMQVQQNWPEKLPIYEEAVNGISREIFGKRQEYYDALQDLHRQSFEMVQARQKQKLEVGRLGDIESDGFLREAQIEGDAWVQNGQEVYLQKEHLEISDLAPAYLVKFEDAEMALSKRFSVGEREATLAYVRGLDGQVHVRSFYRSQSQGMWRLMPEYVGADDGRIDWYGKGYDETSLTLPAQLQKVLSEQEEQADLQGMPPELVFCGTAQRFRSREEFAQSRRDGRLANSVYRELSRQPEQRFGEIMNRRAPEDVTVPEMSQPDFRRVPVAEWTTNTSLYGQVRMTCYESKDRTLQYTFCTDGRARTWVGSIEAKTRTNAAGLRTEWIDMGDVGTPLYEYEQQTGGYGDLNDRRGPYVNMWENYLKKVPMIQEFRVVDRRLREGF